LSAPGFDWGRFKANVVAWLDDSRAVDAGGPMSIRQRLHVARALLVNDTAGLPYGTVDWTHPHAQRVQLAQLEWDSLSEEERAQGERDFRQGHGLCPVYGCKLLRIVGHLNPRGRR
jgi:hypothetical protein